MSPPRTIVHPRVGNPSETVTEYSLPKPKLPASIELTLDPWTKDIIQMDIDDIRAALAKRWSGLKSRANISLREQLLSYEPASLIEVDGIVLLRLQNPKVDSETIGGSAFLPPPFVDDAAARAKFQEYGIDPDSTFAEFLQAFGGLAEDFDCSGNFINLADDWERLSESWQEESIKEFGEWRDSLQIYTARNGDAVLLRADGQIGWWFFAEHGIRHQSDDFEEFLRYYVDYRRIARPLDAYGRN